MTDYKATPEQWVADRYDWCKADTEAMDGDPAYRCILELRARVEALEGKYETQRLATLEWGKDVDTHAKLIDKLWKRVEALEVASRARLIEIIRLINAVADQVPDRNKFLADTMADEDDAKPTPNSSQIGSSLLDLVAVCLNECGGGSWHGQARAVIREVAAWLIDRRRDDDWLAPFEELADLLLEEARQ